jgi:hypothetical protein
VLLFQFNDSHLLKIRRQPHLLGHLANKKLLTSLHSDWILYMWDTQEFRSLQAHRGAYKTTAITIIGTIWHMLFHPNDRIAVVRKKYSDASSCINNIRQIMGAPEIKMLFKYAHGVEPKLLIRRENALLFNFKRDKTPENSVDAYGLETDITGKHYDKIICDDFVTLADKISTAERERTINVIREIQTNVIDPGKQVIFVGTPWHREDAWKITPEPQKFPITATNILNSEEIATKRASTTPTLFAANYELVHISSESAIFPTANYKKWDFRMKTGVFGHLDAKFSGNHTNALTFMCRTPENRIQAIGFTFSEHIKHRYGFVFECWKRYFCGTMFVETNADKGFLADELKTLGIPITSYHEKTNKHIKIETYLRVNWDKIYWCPDSDDDYINQILDYSEGQLPDDCPDSAACLIRAKFHKTTNYSLYEM